ncbi:MAG: glycerol-3-phosphate dehydrogenase [Myxococcota bacterium]|nr:glycerol-3-phosphate dehydrogenase [Myxococcota bacterium]
MAKRVDMVERLDQEFDLLVIGGGITGASAARDAARRGLKVALVEQQDLAYGTSSRSSKLVHGGLRYLEQGEFSLVFEAVTERRILQDIAPHLVHPLGFVFPVYRSSRRGVFTVNVGMWLYDGLSLFRSPRIHRNLSRRDVEKEEPTLRAQDLKGAPLYFDCATDDARLTLEIALSAVSSGAVVATYTRVVGFEQDQGGRTTGVRVCDVVTGEERSVRAHTVVNATGPWTDQVRAMGDPSCSSLLRPTKGVHLVIERERLSVNNAVVCFHPSDGRVLFAIPWSDRTYVGTTDTDFDTSPGEVAATAADVRYLLDAANHYFPDANLVEADVLSTWAGVRPLIAEPESTSESSVSREHEIRVDSSGLITIAGGKLTTCRRMGGEVVDKAVDLLRVMGVCGSLRAPRTEQEPLPGAVGWPEDDDHQAVVQLIRDAGAGRVEQDTAALLASTYGMRGVDVAERAARQQELATRVLADRPEIMAQVDYAVTHELATTLSDVLSRRTQLFFRDRNQGLGACERVSAYMAGLLGWDEERRAAEVDAYQQDVARSRAWRED